MLEINEVCFKVETSEIDKSKTKSGHGSTGVQNVAIMAKSTVLEDIETSKKQNHVRYFKVVVLEDHKAEGGKPNSEKSSSETTKEPLKWAHIAISNAKRNLLGNYHKIKRKYLQVYLDQFIYKLNRNYFGKKLYLYDRLIITNITAYD